MLKSKLVKGFAALAICSALVAPVFASDAPTFEGPQAGVDGKLPQPPADGKGGPRGEHGGPRGEHGGPFKDLNLTPEQKAKIDEIHKAHRQTERQEIDAVLTPDQLAKLKQHMAEHPHHKGEGKGGEQGNQPPAPPVE